jgi:hypothetical protein
MKKIMIGIIVVLAILSISAVIYLSSNKYNSLERINYWGEHSRCYYDNEQTECGNTRFCATHIADESRCLDLKGTWDLETPEREMAEQSYFMSRDNSNIPKIIAESSISYNITDFCNQAQYGCVMHDQIDYTSHGLSWTEEDFIRSKEQCGRIFCE